MRTHHTIGVGRLTVALVLATGGAYGLAADPPRQRPNVLLIVSDDQGYRDLGGYGGPEIKTPHLDRLAAQGVRLTSFYVTWPACTPSRGSLLTGRYPQRNGTYDMYRNNPPLVGKFINNEGVEQIKTKTQGEQSITQRQREPGPCRHPCKYLLKDDPYPNLKALSERANVLPAFAETRFKPG